MSNNLIIKFKLKISTWLCLCLFHFIGFTQMPKFEWRLENEKLLSPTSYQLDVYIYNTDTADFEISGGTIAFVVDPGWRNGGTITITEQYSELNTNQQTSLALYTPGTSIDYWRKIITIVNVGLGTKIPKGKRINCFRITMNNTVAFSRTIPPKFAWRFCGSPSAGFLTPDANGNRITVVATTAAANPTSVIANQQRCFTPAYWDGSGWIQKSPRTGNDTISMLAPNREVNIYTGGFSGGLDIRGYTLMSGATHFVNSGNIVTVRTDFWNYGTITNSNGSIVFKGNDIQGTDRIQNTVSPFTISKMTQLNPFHITLGGSINVLSQLNFSKGKIILNNNNLTIGSIGTTSGESDSGYVVTNMTGNLIINGLGKTGKVTPVIFPVGTLTDYNPAIIQNSCLLDDIKVKVSKGLSNSSGIVTNNAVSKTWDISEANQGNSNLTIKLQWNALDELPGFSRSSSSIVCNDLPGNWYKSPSKSSVGSGPYSQVLYEYINASKYTGKFSVASIGYPDNGVIDTINYLTIKNAPIPQNKAIKGSTNVVLYRIDFPSVCSNINLNSIKFISSGSYNSNDIVNFKLWYHNKSDLTSGSPVLLATKTTGVDTGLKVFSGLNYSFNNDSNYLLLTADIQCQASNHNISINYSDLTITASQISTIGLTSSNLDITPTPIIDSITGPVSNVFNNANYVYSVPFNTNISYTWTITNGRIVSGQGTSSVLVQWDTSGIGSIKIEGKNQLQCSDTSTLKVTIINNPNCIVLSNAAAPITSPQPGTKNVVLYRVNVNVSCVSTILQSIGFNSSGTYRASDIDNFKIWYHTNSAFDVGTPVLLSIKTSNLDTGFQNFTLLNQNYPKGLGYIFITTDILCKAKSRSITIRPIELSNISFATGNSSGIGFSASTISFNELDIIDSISGPKTNIYTNYIYNYSVNKQPLTNYNWTIKNGTILSGQGTNNVSVQWDSSGIGQLFVEGINQLTCNDTASITVNIFNNPNCIIISSGTVPDNNPTMGTKNVILYRINASITCVPTILKSLKFITSGSYTSNEIDSLKIWYHSDSLFNFGSPILVASKNSGIGPGNQNFTNLNSTIPIGKSYIFITANLLCSPIGSNIFINPIITTDVLFSTGNLISNGLSASSISITRADLVDSIKGTNINATTNFPYKYNVSLTPNISYQWIVSNGNITSGQGTNEITIEWLNNGIGNILLVGQNAQLCLDSSQLQVTISNNPGCVSMANGNAPINNPTRGTKNLVLYRVDFNVSCNSPQISSIQFTTQGNYSSNDISNLKIWYHTGSNFNSGTPVLLATKTTNLNPGLQKFTFFATALPNGVNYIFLTADISCIANKKDIVVKAITNTDVGLSSGTPIGSIFTSSTVNINNTAIIDNIVGQQNVFTSSVYNYNVTWVNGTNYNWTVTNGMIVSGQGTNIITVQWLDSGPGSISVDATNTNQCSASNNKSVVVTNNSPIISLKNGTAPKPIPSKGQNNIVLYRIDIKIEAYDATLAGIKFKTGGNYEDPDISNFKIWYHNNPSFNIGIPVLLNIKTSNTGAGIQEFINLNRILPVDTHFIFITADIPCGANNKVIYFNALTQEDVSFNYGIIKVADFTSKPITINPLPIINNIDGQINNVKTNQNYLYSVIQKEIANYEWLVTNGNILNGQGTNAITVNWISEGLGSVKIKAINQFQCSDSAYLTLNVNTNTTGIETFENISDLIVYPNPNSGQFTIKLNSARKSEVRLNMINHLGQEVWNQNQELNSGKNEIRIDHPLKFGVYLLKLETELGVTTRTIIIQ